MSSLGNKEVMAKNLAYYLERFGKSQKELAEVAGVAPSTFSEWMRAKKYPRIDRIEIMANYFGILKSDLIEDKIEDKKEPATDDGSELNKRKQNFIKKVKQMSDADLARLEETLRFVEKMKKSAH